jgi:hypothetical protein
MNGSAAHPGGAAKSPPNKMSHMKNKVFSLAVLLALAFNGFLAAQSNILDLGIFKKPNEPGKLEVRIRPAQNVTNAAYSAGVFTVRFPSDYGVTLSEVQGSSPYGFTFAGPVGKVDGYDYYRYQFAGSVHMVSWEKWKEYPALTLQINGAPPSNAVFQLTTGNDWTREQNAEYYQELNAMEAQRRFYYLPGNKIFFFFAIPKGGKNVQLEWKFESDTDLEFTQIEYSVDGIDFKPIGVMPAHDGVTRAVSPYQFLHENVPSNVNFYRLLMADVNGDEHYSQIRLVNFDDLDADFSIFPNPTSGPLTLLGRNLENYDSDVQYQLVDNNGRILHFGPVTNGQTNLDFSGTAPGTYYLKLWSGQEQVAMFKVVVVKK